MKVTKRDLSKWCKHKLQMLKQACEEASDKAEYDRRFEEYLNYYNLYCSRCTKFHIVCMDGDLNAE